MEIHHHTNTHKGHKKWTHYLFDFFMLFLAVFFGYLAESRLENKTEDSREYELMQALVQDLKADIFMIDSLKIKREERDKEGDSLILLLTNPALNKNNNNKALIYFYGRNASRRMHFRPQDGTLKQLRAAGGFRVVHDSTILSDINTYELLLTANQENIEVEEKELSEYSSVAARVFSAKVFQEMMPDSTIIKPPGVPSLISYDPILLNELCVKLHYWKRTSLSVLGNFIRLKKMAILLIREIQTRYKEKRKK